MEKERMERISFTIPPELNKQLRRHLEKIGDPPLSWFIRNAIKALLEKHGI